MAKRKRQIEIHEDTWLGIKQLSKRYNKPMIRVADTIFDTNDLKILDKIFKGRKKLEENL